MMILGMLIFSFAIFTASYLISKAGDFDQGKVSTYITLIGWGSLIFGLYIGKMAP